MLVRVLDWTGNRGNEKKMMEGKKKVQEMDEGEGSTGKVRDGKKKAMKEEWKEKREDGGRYEAKGKTVMKEGMEGELWDSRRKKWKEEGKEREGGKVARMKKFDNGSKW